MDGLFIHSIEMVLRRKCIDDHAYASVKGFVGNAVEGDTNKLVPVCRQREIRGTGLLRQESNHQEHAIWFKRILRHLLGRAAKIQFFHFRNELIHGPSLLI